MRLHSIYILVTNSSPLTPHLPYHTHIPSSHHTHTHPPPSHTTHTHPSPHPPGIIWDDQNNAWMLVFQQLSTTHRCLLQEATAETLPGKICVNLTINNLCKSHYIQVCVDLTINNLCNLVRCYIITMFVLYLSSRSVSVHRLWWNSYCTVIMNHHIYKVIYM